MKSREELSELVIRFNDGDMEALGEIYIEIKDYLSSRLKKNIRGHEDLTEDIIHEAFLKALERMDGLRDPDAVITWLRTVAINTARDLMRKESRYISLAPIVDGDGNEHDWIEDIPDCSAESDVEEVVCRKEINRRVDDMLQKIGSIRAALMLMHDSYGVPISEISSRLNMKKGTIKSTLYRARKELREIWQSEAA